MKSPMFYCAAGHCSITESSARALNYTCPECKRPLSITINTADTFNEPDPNSPADKLRKKFTSVSTKTLKLKVKDGTTLTDAIYEAKAFLAADHSNYTRIEFPFQGFYYVVAKLKEQE